MEPRIKITDRRKFLKVDEIDTGDIQLHPTGVSFVAMGTLFLRLTSGRELTESTGCCDYSEEFGFKLEPYEFS